MVRTLIGVLFLGLCMTAAAQQAKKNVPLTPGGKWKRGDMNRPRPKVVDPGTPGSLQTPGRPPSDAEVLFNGTDLSQWETKLKGGAPSTLRWIVKDGYMEAPPVPENDERPWLTSKKRFRDCQIHVEWATPAVVSGKGQGRGNSGIILSGHGEIQVLDSFENDTYPDGQAGALYGRYPPLVNASRKPGQWQMYDIIFEAPKFDENNKVLGQARITVLHNGVVVHHAIDTGSEDPEIQITLQHHRNPIRFRNIWVRRLNAYDEP